MTRIERSPEQLDAEAAVAVPIIEQSLDALIEDHRALYRTDLGLYRLHDAGASNEADEARKAKPKTNGHVATWTGLPFSAPFSRFIDWRKDREEEGVRPSSPGQTFPWSTAFYGQWAECRRSHPEHHGRPEWRGSLCRQLVSLTVRGELSLNDACLVLGVTPQRAGRTLSNALLWIESSIDRARNRQAERRKPVREQRIVAGIWRDRHERHDMPGMHAAECPQCRVAS